MDICIYPSCDRLPFQGNPMNPELVYDGSGLDEWRCLEDAVLYPIDCLSVYPVLQGLVLFPVDGILAHINLCYDIRQKTLSLADRTWLEFSTEPALIMNGLPIIIGSDGLPAVKNLWQKDHGYMTPYDLRGDMLEDEDTPIDWYHFFLRLIRDQKAKLLRGISPSDKGYHDLESAFSGL